MEGYGLTETSPIVAVNTKRFYKIGTVGKALHGVEIKIAHDKEICLRGPIVMKGYHTPSVGALPSSPIDSDGWFHTGDLGFIDHDGYVTVVCRLKEMIATSGGKKIWPEKIEALLNHYPLIHQSMIIGHGRKCIGALIVPTVGVKVGVNRASVEGIIHEINTQLSEHEKIHKFIIVSDEFSQKNGELTPTLKLCRNVIERSYEKEIEEMYR